jgi:hypothetical protein
MAASAENESEAAHITSTTSKHEHKTTVIATRHQLKEYSYLFYVFGESGGDVGHERDTSGKRRMAATAENGERGGDSLHLSVIR